MVVFLRFQAGLARSGASLSVKFERLQIPICLVTGARFPWFTMQFAIATRRGWGSLKIMLLPLFTRLLALSAMLTIMGCSSIPSHPAEVAAKPRAKSEDSPVNLPFLLSMDFQEASAISKQHESVGPHLKVAADEITVLRRDAKGQLRKLRATGHVFVQLDHDVHGGHALCQEALISDEDLILRGHPLLQRGLSIVEGLSDVTVFYMLGGNRLRAIGPHKLTNPDQMSPSAPAMVAWQNGPNPLLPPLDAGVVPEAVRAEMQKAAEAEAVLQKSRAGMAPAFPNAPQLGPMIEVKEPPKR